MSTLPADAFPPDLEAYVQQEIAAGRFQSREEFALTAARAYRDFDERRKQLKADIEAAIAEADAGLCEPLDIEQIKAELMAELDWNGQPKAR
jgi:Arc/MetJ-type ribon-helix-helix transcriptional regulator